MATKILVAGATGNIGGRIIRELLERKAEVRVLVRATADKDKVEKLNQQGVEIIRVTDWNISELTKACEGVACVVSALQGLHDVIVDAQSVLLDAAVAAGVQRFIPSDFATDITKVPKGFNRNFDLRKEFHEYLDKAAIRPTSIMNGAFAEILTYNVPLLNFKEKTVGYWGSADWRIDFSTMDNTAAYTAAAAMDASAPRILRIASFQVTPAELAEAAGEILHTKFELKRLGSPDDLAAYNQHERTAHPEGENEVFPSWQRSQYTHGMFTVHFEKTDNTRYPDIHWTSLNEVLAQK